MCQCVHLGNVCYNRISILFDKIILHTLKVSLRMFFRDPSVNFDILKSGSYYSTDIARGPAMTFLKDVASFWYCRNFDFLSNISNKFTRKEIHSEKRHRLSLLISMF